MAKQSGYLKRLQTKNETKYAVLFQKKINTTMQLVQDAAFLAAAEVFHMGPGRCEAFGASMIEYANEIARMMLNDMKDDPAFEYTKEKVDRRLKQICGDNFESWEVRYGTKSDKSLNQGPMGSNGKS